MPASKAAYPFACNVSRGVTWPLSSRSARPFLSTASVSAWRTLSLVIGSTLVRKIMPMSDNGAMLGLKARPRGEGGVEAPPAHPLGFFVGYLQRQVRAAGLQLGHAGRRVGRELHHHRLEGGLGAEVALE